LPATNGVPLSRWSREELASEVRQRGIAAKISGITIWRWLSKDAIRPWQHRSWIFPRDRQFKQKASRVLDLYQGLWEGRPLGDDEFVLSSDEKTSIQARMRISCTEPPKPGKSMRVEHEYERGGALAYLAAWDVHRAKIFGRCETQSGIVAFHRLVDQVMSKDPYRHARRVFWIVDNGSSHRGAACVARLRDRWKNLVVVHLPVHASWLNQIEVYFSIVQRKVLTPNDFDSLIEMEQRLLDFQDHYQRSAKPFQWKFTQTDLDNLLNRLDHPPLPLAKAA
jgi:hypothetical protein